MGHIHGTSPRGRPKDWMSYGSDASRGRPSAPPRRDAHGGNPCVLAKCAQGMQVHPELFMDPTIRVRPVEPADAEQWLELRARLWADEEAASLTDTVERFLDPSQDGRIHLEAVLVAEARDPTRLVGFAELSRR